MNIRYPIYEGVYRILTDKVLMVEMHEKGGGRHQTFTVESEDIVRAGVINELKVK